MDTLLITIGVLGLGALLIATWVFVSAARRYVTGDSLREELEALQSDLSPYNRQWTPRGSDRRQSARVLAFPTTINGEYVVSDRRRQPDRRERASA